MQAVSPRRHAAASLLATVLVAAGPFAAGSAHAAGAHQSALCDGYTVGTCAITTDSRVAAQDQLLRVQAVGHPGVSLTLQFYVIEFNSRGQITGLVPSGNPVEGVTRSLSGGRGTLDEARLVPRTVPDVPGGWGFVGLADDTSLDLRSRLGAVVEFGGRTLKLLGDGYADQKPVGVPLDLHVIGNVPGVGYWVEYLAADGTWTAVEGQGYGAAQRLLSSPGEVSHLSYTVPTDLVPGQAYRFRINHHLNYGGAEDRPIAAPAHAEWTVIPSEHGEAGERGQQLDPSKGPGTPDPQGPGDTGGGGNGSPAPAPSGPPGPGSPGGPGGTVPPKPSSPPAPEADDADPQAPAAAPPPQPTTAAGAPRPSSSAGPSATTGPDAPTSTPGGSAPASSSDPIWGEEARAVPPPRIGETHETTRWALAALLLALLASPAAWMWARHRFSSRGGDSW